jgi:outer membrane immunogenic protein
MMRPNALYKRCLPVTYFTERLISMKFTTTALLGATAFIASTAPAFAQDGDDWSGPYIGGSIGIGAQNNDGGESVEFDTNLDGSFGDTVNTTAPANAFSPEFCGGTANGRTPAEGCRSDRDGMEYAIRAGYDMQSGNLVYGILLEGVKSNARDSVSAFSTTPAFYTLTRELDYSLGARLRVGYATGPGLFYVTGGGAYGKIDNSFATSNTANSFTNNGNSKSFGWSAGGGAEVKIAGGLTLGLEYLYTNYFEDDYEVDVGRGTAALTNPFLLVNPNGTTMRRSDENFDMHAIRLTAGFRF